MTLPECCMQIQPLDETAMQAAQQHWNQLAKPLHSLGRLEDMIVQLAGIHRSAQLEQRKKVVLIFCADNLFSDWLPFLQYGQFSSAVSGNLLTAAASLSASSAPLSASSGSFYNNEACHSTCHLSPYTIRPIYSPVQSPALD